MKVFLADFYSRSEDLRKDDKVKRQKGNHNRKNKEKQIVKERKRKKYC